jgi:hypothetical protein
VQKKFLPPKTSTKGVQPMKQSVIVKSTLAVILAALTLTTHSQAQTGILAQPVGIFTVPVVGPKKLNLLATPFARPAVAQGTISAQSGSTLTVSQVPVMASDTPYILEILDGDYIGVVSLVTASTGSTVTIQYTLPAGAIASGTRYGIRPDWTVAELFGPAAISNGYTQSPWSFLILFFCCSGCATVRGAFLRFFFNTLRLCRCVSDSEHHRKTAAAALWMGQRAAFGAVCALFFFIV